MSRATIAIAKYHASFSNGVDDQAREVAKAYLEIMLTQLERDALIMANTRRIMRAKRIKTNTSLYMDIFGVGMTTSISACVKLGLDPEGNETHYNSMIDYIRAEASRYNKPGS